MRNLQFYFFAGPGIFFLITQFTAGSYSGRAVPQTNTRPKVKIVSPQNTIKFKRDQLVTFGVEVSDKEEGESKYQEISANEIFLEVKFFADPAKGNAYLKAVVQNDPAGLLKIKRSDCFNCHQVRDKLIGPSFEQLSQKYPPTQVNILKLAQHIQKGSTGVWGQAAMPAHENFSAAESRKIVEWILSNGSLRTVSYYRGVDGAFWCKPPANDKRGVFVLTASYTDHGVGEDHLSELKGQHRLMIRE